MVQPTLMTIAEADGSNVITPSAGNFQLFLALTGEGVYTLFSKSSTGDVNAVKAGATNVTITLTP